VPGLSVQRVVVATALFIVVYSSFTIAANAARRYQLTTQTRQLQQTVASDQADQRRLEALKRYLGSDEFIESAARQEGLVRPGDVPVFVTAPTPPATPEAGASGAWWERYFAP